MANKKKARRPLKQFGDFLKHARVSAGIRSQKDVVEKLSKSTYPISHADMCRYEQGTIYDPTPQQLKELACIYRLEYITLVLQLMLDKYSLRADKYFAFFEEIIAARYANKKLLRLLKDVNSIRVME